VCVCEGDRRSDRDDVQERLCYEATDDDDDDDDNSSVYVVCGDEMMTSLSRNWLDQRQRVDVRDVKCQSVMSSLMSCHVM